MHGRRRRGCEVATDGPQDVRLSCDSRRWAPRDSMIVFGAALAQADVAVAVRGRESPQVTAATAA
jgi:hypothetical protein